MLAGIFYAAILASSVVNAVPYTGTETCGSNESALKTLKACATKTSFCVSIVHPATTTSVKTSTITAKQSTHTSTKQVVVTTCVSAVAPAKQKRNYVTSTKTTTSSTKAASGTICGLSEYPSSRWTQVCTCIGVTAGVKTTTTTKKTTITPKPTTVTVKSTSTLQSCSTTSASACHEGIEFAIYPNDQGGNDDDTYSQFDPIEYKKQTPVNSSVIDYIGFLYGTYPIYNTPAFTGGFFVIDHRGYLYAQKSGIYTFTSSLVDDLLFVWLGADAFSGWDRSNTDSQAFWTPENDVGSASAILNAEEGSYYPFRVLFAQGTGGYEFGFQITDPDGVVLLGPNPLDDASIVTSSCDGTSAPPFPAWGSET